MCLKACRYGSQPFLLLPSLRMENTPPETREELAAERPDPAFSLLSWCRGVTRVSIVTFTEMFRGVANTNYPSILERFGTTRIYPNGIQHGPTRRSFGADPTRHDPIFCSPSETRHESTRNFETRIYTNLHESNEA